jgi:hypothetical protein
MPHRRHYIRPAAQDANPYTKLLGILAVILAVLLTALGTALISQ